MARRSYRESLKINGKNGYSEDTLTRIRYFAEDAEAYGFDDKQMEKMAESIKGVNLHKRLRNRESRPSDTQLRNFFDDITLKYVMHGNVPDAKDLKKVYEEASL